MFIAKWYNVELKEDQAWIFKEFLEGLGIKFESSGCYNLIHFEMFITSQYEFNSIESFLDTLPD